MLAPGRPARATLGQPDPDQGALQGGPGAGKVRRLYETTFEDVLGLASGSFSPLEVDLGAEVRRLGQDHDPIGADLDEAAENGDFLLLAAGLDTQHALAEQRDQRRMMRQDAHLALAPGHDDLVDVAGEGSPFRSHDLEVEWHWLCLHIARRLAAIAVAAPSKLGGRKIASRLEGSASGEGVRRRGWREARAATAGSADLERISAEDGD